MSALARELEEARQRVLAAADERIEAYREALTAAEKDAAYWRAECRAAEVARDGSRIDAETAERERDEMRRALIERDRVLYSVELALGEACTGDLARDVTGLVATLREHEIALARARKLVEWECTARQEARDGLRALLDAWRVGGMAWPQGLAVAHALVASWNAKPAPAPQPEALQLCTPEAPEPPHAVGDTWRLDDGKEHEVCGFTKWGSSRDKPEYTTLAFKGGAAGRPEWLRANGCERIRCASEAPKVVLAVGDPVHVRLGDREAVGTVTRSPADGTLEAWRVAGAEGQEVYAREADIERVAVEGVK